MTDDTHDLKALFEAATPRPDAERRAATLAMAQHNFERQFQARHEAKDAGYWSRWKAWYGGAFASIAVVATAVVLVAPVNTPVMQAPAALEMTRSASESSAALATAPQNFSRSMAQAPVMLADDSADAMTQEFLSYAQIRQSLIDGQAPAPGAVGLSAFLDRAGALLLPDGEGTQMRATPVPWEESASLILIGSRGFLDDADSARPNWQLLGTATTTEGLIAVYRSPEPTGLDTSDTMVLVTSLVGFVSLLNGTVETDWTYADALALIQSGIAEEPLRAELAEMITRARDLAR